MVNFLKFLLKEVKILKRIFWFLFCLFYDFWNLSLSRLDLSRKNLKNKEFKIYYNYSVFKLKEKFSKIFLNFYFFDFVFIKIKSYKYINFNLKINSFRNFYRVLNTKQGFYNNYNINNKKYFFSFLTNIFMSGYKYIWIGLKFWFLPIIVCFLIVYVSLVLKGLPFNKIMFSWISIVMFSYWLISGFVFFFKKYQFGKYTTAIQRFWRRSYILFWLIEGGTFLVFFFFTLNASQESFYMFDQISIFKTHLYSWKLFLIKLFPTFLLIIITYLLIISLKWNIFTKYSIWLLVITFFLTYVVWLEFYQFFHVLNFYGNLNWIYDIDDHSWSLELEPRRTRIVNHYVMLLFILKFWHIVFIYGFWIFFVLRCWETKRIRYPLLSANFQNFIILYIFAWVFMYPWFKFFFRKFLDSPYYWFYVNNRKLFFRVFYNDLKLIFYSFLNYFDLIKNNFLKKFYFDPFFYWKSNEINGNYEFFRKHIIRDRVIISLK